MIQLLIDNLNYDKGFKDSKNWSILKIIRKRHHNTHLQLKSVNFDIYFIIDSKNDHRLALCIFAWTAVYLGFDLFFEYIFSWGWILCIY